MAQFSVLADDSRNWPAKAVGSNVTFTWVMTARHRTSNWEYFIGDTEIATVDGGNAQPDAVVTHNVDLSAFPGRQTVLAVWNIGDTANAVLQLRRPERRRWRRVGTFHPGHPATFGHQPAATGRRAGAARHRPARRRHAGTATGPRASPTGPATR